MHRRVASRNHIVRRMENHLAHSWHDASDSCATAIPLVCLHGSLCDQTFYAPLNGAIPGCRALCVDLPGHGASGRAPHGASLSLEETSLSLEEMATAVLALLKSLEVTRSDWAVAGHSLGGAVALLVIELIANGDGEDKLPRFFLSFEGNATPACCAADGLARRVAALPQPPEAAEMLQMLASTPPWLASASRIGESVGVLAHRIFFTLVEWCDGRTMHGSTLEEMQRRVPLRYVYGSASGKYHASNQAAHARHPDAAAASVEGASHFMLTDDPSATVAAVKRLLVGLLQEEVQSASSCDDKRTAALPMRAVEPLEALNGV